MSLLKQLLLSVTVAIAAILIGTLAFSIAAARQYLDGQLQSESENAASALALSLSQPGNQDPVTRELLMMALYDSGQFRMIRLTSPGGQEIFARVRPDGASGPALAPAWFSRWLPLAQPRVERAVSDGWRQVGQLAVSVDNGYARDALWHGSVRMATWVLGAGLTWALFVLLLLRWFRRVLSEEVAAQVRAIADRTPEVPARSRHPRLTELSSVITAIRDTREVVRATAQEQSTRIESLELEVHRDPVTSLSNRKYFVNELRKALAGGAGQAPQGYVLLARQRDLLALNAHMTRGSADEWLKTVGERLTRELAGPAPQPGQGMQLARLNSSDFVVLMPGLEGPRAMLLVQRMRHALQSMRVVLANGQGCRWAYALTDYAEGSTVSDVMARLDQALMRAESAGHGDIEYVAYAADGGHRATVGEGQWQGILAAALDAPEQLSLAIQAQTYAGPGATECLHDASLTLQVPNGTPMAGGLFLPVAARLGLSADFDLRAVTLGLHWLDAHPQQTLVLRISLQSLAQADFLAQMVHALQAASGPQVLGRLILELDAHDVITSPEDVAAFCETVQHAGAQVGLRRLDHAPLALTRLHALPLQYVKLGADVAEQAPRSPGLRYLLEAMFATARGQGMRVYITTAVDGEVRAWLERQGVGVPVAATST